MSDRLRLTFLGCGFITQVHSRNLRSLGGDVVCSYASRDKARADDFCRRFGGTQSYGHYSSAIDDQRLMDQIYATAGLRPQ